MSNPVKYSDLVEADALRKVAEDARLAISLLNEIIAKQKTAAAGVSGGLGVGRGNNNGGGTGGGGKYNIEEVKRYTTAIKDAESTEHKYMQAVILKQEAQKNEKAAVKGLTSAYQEMQNKKNELEKLAKDSAAREMMDGKVISANTQKLMADSRAYNNSLKQIDYTLGNHQRNVGNYNEKLGALSKSLKGFGALGGIITRAIGVDPEVFMGIKEAGMALRDVRHTMEGAKLAKEGETVAVEANTVALEAETAAQESEAVAAGLSTGGILLIVGALVAAGVAIYEYVSASQEQERQDKANLEVEKASLKILIETAKLRATSAKELDNIAIDEAVALGKITDEQAKKIKLGRETDIEAQSIHVKEKQRIEELAKGYGIDVNAHVENNIEKTDAEIKFLNESKKIHEDAQKLIAALDEKFFADSAKVDSDHKIKELEKKKEVKQEHHKENEYYLAEYDKFVNKMFEDDDLRLKHLKETLAEGQKVWDEYLSDIHNVNQAAFHQELLKEKEKRNKIIDEEEKTTQSVLEGIEAGLQKKEDLQQASDQKMIDFHTRTAEIEATLAAGGKRNNLAQEQAAAAKAEEKKIQDAKKAAKVQEDIALIDTFSKVYAAALKNSDGSTGSFLKAFAQAGAAEGLVKAAFSKMFSGYYSGTEDTGGGGNLDNKGGELAIIHPHERILTAEQNKILGNVSNDELVDTFQNVYTPQYNSANTSATSIIEIGHDEKLAKIIKQEFNSLQKSIENQPKETFKINGLNDIQKTITEGQMNTVIHFKQNNMRPSLRLRG